MTKSVYFKVFLISLSTYILFFFRLLSPQLTVYSGKDSTNLHYPTRQYLNEKLNQREFPFWTERIFSGFPIYADIERGYLHPVNIGATLLLGPINSYKFLHVFTYFIGSFSLFLFLKRKKIGLLGYSVANLAFYFSFFHIYHQQHFNIILSTYLLPTVVLLSDLFTETKKLRHLFLNALVISSSVYFGSFQMTALLLLTQLLYTLSSLNKNTLKLLLKSQAVLALLLIILSLPVLLPASELFLESQRQGVGISYTEGSFAPANITNIVYPFAFGSLNSYFGTSLNSEYLKHETYNYTGIGVFIFALLGSFISTDKTLKKFLYLLVASFCILGFIGFIPLVSNLNLPFINLFRYWGRSTVLFSFSVSIFAGVAINELLKKPRFNFDYKNLKYLGLIFIYFFFLFLFNIKNETNITVLKGIISRFAFNTNFVIWLVICIFCLVVVFINIRFKPKIVYLGILFIFLDLVYFGNVVLGSAFIKKQVVIPHNNALNLNENKRIVVLDKLADANKGLYFKNWGVFGYSQLASKQYIKYLKDIGFEKEKSTKMSPSYSKDHLYESFENLGVSGVFENSVMTSHNYELVRGDNAQISQLVSKEGEFLFNVNALDNSLIRTSIRNYDDWYLFVDGSEREFENKDTDLFLSFEVSRGRHSVGLRYIPRKFYFGIIYSLALSTLLFGYFWILRKRNVKFF